MSVSWQAIAAITGSASLLVLLIAAIVGIIQLRILQVRHRLDTAPFIKFDLEMSTPSIPTNEPNLDVRIIPIDELDEWAKTKRRAAHRYMIFTLHNKQTHIAASATDVGFRLVFRFPKYGTPNAMVRVRRYIRGTIWLEPDEIYKVVFADLKGVPAGTIDIDEVRYYDVDRNKYKRGYGYSHWELDNVGVQSRHFREFH